MGKAVKPRITRVSESNEAFWLRIATGSTTIAVWQSANLVIEAGSKNRRTKADVMQTSALLCQQSNVIHWLQPHINFSRSRFMAQTSDVKS